MVLVAWGTAPAAEAPSFRMEGPLLRVRSSALEVGVQAGAVVYLKDLRTNETFAAGEPGEALKLLPVGAALEDDSWAFLTGWKKDPAVYAARASRQTGRRYPREEAVPDFRQVMPWEGELTYRDLVNAQPEHELRLRVTVDKQSGDVLLSASARLSAGETPVSLDLPLVNFHCASVILGNGAQYFRADPRQADLCVRRANNLNSPRMAVVVGQKGCLAVWGDRFGGYGNLTLAHDSGSDALVLSSAPDPHSSGGGVIGSDSWRLSVCRDWLEAARLYRRSLEQQTGARPLWEHSCPWVRGIHAALTEVPTADRAEAFYADLAKQFDPRRLLLFYWNGSHILMFGDHTYAPQSPTSPAVIAALKQQGFRWLGYHPWTLVFSPKGAAERMKDLERRGWLPPGWRFSPDYAGPPEKFTDYFRPFAAGYYGDLDKAQLWLAHPGSAAFRSYFLRNFSNYCRAHQMDGAYLDTMGGDASYHFPADRKLIEGLSFREGEAKTLAEVRKAHPDLALMSEMETEWVIPYAFYTWEGGSHVNLPRAHPSVETRLNHPLRGALWGSYTWCREESIDPAESALLACLPDVNRPDEWSVARARLFCEEELHNDLPPRWEPEALAYYRGRGDRWYQFRRMPWGDAYVEEPGARVRLGRYSGVEAGPLPEATHIQDWVAYKGDRPVGLNPRRTYPFVLGPPAAEQAVVLSGLPEGVCVNAVRPSGKQLVVELDRRPEGPQAAEVAVTCRKPCLRVCGTAQDWSEPWPAGETRRLTTPLPGGLVFVWEETPPKDWRLRSDYNAANGQGLARGTPAYGWTYNSYTRVESRTVGEEAYPTLVLGWGRFRGWAEHWVALAAEAEPVLKFSYAYAPEYDVRRERAPWPMAVSVLVNGTEVWREQATPAPRWQAREVPLGAFRGRQVLITLSAQYAGDTEVIPAPDDRPVLWGRVHVDGNPTKQQALDGAALPQPAQVLFRDDFAGPDLNPVWSRHISPGHGEGAKIEPQQGRLAFVGQHYRYNYLSQVWPAEATVAQARFQVYPSGCAPEWNPGLGLWWGPEKYTFFTGGVAGSDYLAIRGYGPRRISLAPRGFRVLDDNRLDFYLRISLSAERITYWSSLDGQSWTEEAQVARPAEYREPPQLLLLGRGTAGTGEVFNNDAPWPTGINTVWAGEVVVGRE